MAKANKLVPVVDGTAGTPIELQDSRIYTNSPNDGDLLVYNQSNSRFETESINTLMSNITLASDVVTCQMTGQFANSAWMTDGTTEQEVENAVLSGKMVVCTLLNQSISSEPITLFAQSMLSPYPVFTGICKIGNNLAYISVIYDEDNSTSEYEVWKVESAIFSQSVLQDVFLCNFNNSTKTMDKSANDIITACDNNKVVMCKCNGGIYYCNVVSNNMIVFSLLKAGIAYNGSGTEIVGITEPTAQYIVYSSTANAWEISTLKTLQEKLISGSNIKTINGNSLLGSGNLTISGGNVNVQSDWNQTDNTADDFIKNKPTIPTLPTIDTALSETSTNPIQNKAINVLTRKLWQGVDIISRLGSEYPTVNKQISSGSWSSSSGSAYKHWAIPVDGMRTVSVTANSSQYAILTFLKTYNSTTGTPDFATGYTGNTTILADQTRILNVPSDANWLIVMTGNNGARKPDHIYLTGVAANYPQLTYVQLASGATTCDVSLTDTKQSFVIDNSANSSSIPITVTNQFNDIYSNENISINKNLVVQFDFESVESEQKTLLFVKKTAMYDRTV